MQRKTCSFAVALLAVSAVVSMAVAQGRGGAGGGSGFGGGTSSFGGGGSSFGGSSAFGSSMGGMGQSAFGGGIGGSGFGGSSAFGGSSGFGGTSSFGGGIGGQGMGGAGMGGQNFVGRDGGDMQAIMGQMGRAGTQFFNTMSTNMNRNRNRQQPQTTENEKPPVRIRLELGFTPAPVVNTAVASSITTRLARLSVDHSLGRPQISMEGDTVVLRGIADSESQRTVLEKFVMLEPGVMHVRNEMVVAGESSAVSPATAPTTEEPLPEAGN